MPDAIARAARGLELIPPDYFAPLPLAQWFPPERPLEVDAGSGEGAFLLAMAEKYPGRSFLGIERERGRVNNICHRAARRNLQNLRVLRLEIDYAVTYMLPPDSVSRFYLLFPDPWPKRRHHRRRVVNSDFLRALHGRMERGGQVILKTDHQDYFQHMQKAWQALDLFNEQPPDVAGELPLSDFEMKFRRNGKPVYRTVLVKT